MMDKPNNMKWARIIAGMGLLCFLPAFSEDASETSSPSPPPSSLSGSSSGMRNQALEQLSTGAYVNQYTGQASFSVPLATISNHGGISFAVALKYYGGGLEHRSASQSKYNPSSWVG